MFLINLNNILKKFTKKPKFDILEKMTRNLYCRVDDFKQFYKINLHIVEIFMKNPYSLNKADDKWESELFNDKLNETSEHFVKWLIQ
jgi:hypothetical protein